MKPRESIMAALVLLAAACSPAHGQDRSDPPYQPLFTEEMIGKAAPEQRERMRAAEANNRQAFERRQQEKARSAAVGAAPPTGAPAPRQVRPRRSKIYKWVDDRGRVNFGDVPAGKDAEEITIRGSTAPTPPASGNVPRNGTPTPPRDSGRNRDQRRGS